MRSSRRLLIAAAAGLFAVGCGSDAATNSETGRETVPVTEPADTLADAKFPDIIDATASLAGGTWTFDVTVSSPYDSPERYADGWRILGPDDAEYGFRLLTHDHASEQPFTRSLSDVQIPDGVDVVTIQGRDQVSGFGGATFEVTLSAS